MYKRQLFWWPGRIKPGVVTDVGTTLDILPTFFKLANITLPGDRIYDGYDLSPLLFGTGSGNRDVVFYYRNTQVFAVRKGAYKAHFFTQPDYGNHPTTIQDPPLLYNLNVDPSEKYNIAGEHPEIIAEIEKVLKAHLATVSPVENQLEK